MSKSKETHTTPPADGIDVDAAVDAAAPTDLEQVVQQFWEKNRNLLFGLTAVILIAIFARSGLAAYQTGQIESAREDYAAATTDTELKAFAADHAGTTLAGVALLDVADKAAEEGRYSDAIASYDAAATELADTVFSDRVSLGRAMAMLLGDDAAGGESALRDLANSTEVTAPVRAEAIYHLAAIALTSGNATELDALITQVDAVSPGSTWSQRVTMMRSTLASGGETGNGISFPSP